MGSDEEAGKRLIELMEAAKCDPSGIEAVSNLLLVRTLPIALNRAEYWFSLVGAEPPTFESLF